MKMRNDDLKKITEIKQYLLDPPVSFKLYELANSHLIEAINVLSNYANAKDLVKDLKTLSSQLANKEVEQTALRSVLKKTGIQLGNLTNK